MQKRGWRRFLPLLLLAAGIIGVYSLGWHQILSFAALKAHHEILKAWTVANPIAAVLVFCGIYIVTVALSIPGATFITLAGGYLFGPWGAVWVVLSATIGATFLYMAVRFAIGEWLVAKAKGWAKRLEVGFLKNAFFYLLFLRLVPLFPFWVVNIVPAVLNVNLKTFVSATFLGIIPGSVVYVLVGNGLNTVFAREQTPNLNIIFTPSVFYPLLALAFLALVPVLYRVITAKKEQ